MIGEKNMLKFMVGMALTAWAVGIGIALYVGYSTLVLDKDFGGRGRVGAKHRHTRIHR